MSHENKIPYRSSTKRRFEVSKDPYSRERLHTLLATHRELKEHIPFYAGMTLFGSLSKGKKLDATLAEFSDVDVYTFVNVDILNTHAQSFIEQFDGLKLRIDGASTQDMKRLFPNLSDEDILAIAGIEYLKKVTEASLFKKSLTQQPRPHFSVRSAAVSLHGTYSTRNKVELYEEDLQYGGFRKEQLEFEVAAPFFFDIGGNLAGYRQAFLREIQNYPHDIAENIWSRVAQCSAQIERQGFIPENVAKHYPKTVSEAVVFYIA